MTDTGNYSFLSNQFLIFTLPYRPFHFNLKYRSYSISMNSKELEIVDEQLNCTCIYYITGLDITNTAICFQFLIHACVVLAIMCIDKILCFMNLLIDKLSNLQLTFA